MKANDIKEFIDIIGPNTNYQLFGDNANNFKTEHGEIMLDTVANMLYFIGHSENTMENQDPVSFQMCETDMIQYCQAKLTKEVAEEVLKKLKDKGLMTEKVYAKHMKDNLLFGIRDRKKSIDPEIVPCE